MNIALVIEKFFPFHGGREASTAQIAFALAARGHSVTILCQAGDIDEEHHDVNLRRLLDKSTTRAGNLRRFATIIQNISHAKEFDIIHSMLPLPGVDVFSPRGGSIPANLATIRLRDGRRRETLSRIGRTLNAKRRLEAKFERELVANPRTLILTNSAMVAEEYHRYYGRTDNVVSVFNAVELPPMDAKARDTARCEIRTALGLADSDTLLLTAAKNFKLKGVFEAIDALYLTPGNIHLLAVGANDCEPANRHAEKLGLGERFHTLEPQLSLMGVFAACDAVVLLSWYDACSRVILEAVNFPRPVVTTKLNGAAEILASGAGFVVQSPADRVEIAAAFVRLSSIDHREQCLQAGRELGDIASMDRQIEETIRHYETIRREN